MARSRSAGAPSILPLPRARHVRPPRRHRSLATERDYQATVIDTAKILGWRVHHSRPAWTKQVAHPDPRPRRISRFCVAHPLVGVLFIELKYSTKLTVDQARWGDVLTLAGADWRELRVPEDLDIFCQSLADRVRDVQDVP